MLLGTFPIGHVPLGFVGHPAPTPPPPHVCAIPNGRWRAVVGPGGIANHITDLSPVKDEVGFTLYLDSPISLPAGPVELVFTKPSGATLTVEACVYTGQSPIAGYLTWDNTYIAYTFADGDLDQQGMWSVYPVRNNVPLVGAAPFLVLGPVQ